MTEQVWLVKHKIGVDQVLAMIRDRYNPDRYIARSYWFEDRARAEEFIFTQTLKTGETYTLIHRDDIEDSTRNRVKKILRNNNG